GRDLLGIPSGVPSVAAVLNTVDLMHFAPAGSALDLDVASGLPPAPTGVIRVGLVATFARWKGHETVLRALAEVARFPSNPPVRGYIVGRPVYQADGSKFSLEELRALAGELGIGDRVGFTGFVGDTAPALRALDIVVHASTRPEPFGLVIAEAMACGRPIIVSDAGGAREVVNPGMGGLCARPCGHSSPARSL